MLSHVRFTIDVWSARLGSGFRARAHSAKLSCTTPARFTTETIGNEDRGKQPYKGQFT